MVQWCNDVMEWHSIKDVKLCLFIYIAKLLYTHKFTLSARIVFSGEKTTLVMKSYHWYEIYSSETSETVIN